MADRQGRSGSGRGKLLTIIVILAVVVAGWWLFNQWNQEPATMPATGQAPVQNPTEGAPMMKGDPAQGRDEGLEGDIRQTAPD